MQAVCRGVVLFRLHSVSKIPILREVKEKLGFIDCDNLLLQKARILLMLALAHTNDDKENQQMFHEHGRGKPHNL